MKSNLTKFKADTSRLRTALDLEESIQRAQSWSPPGGTLSEEGDLLVAIKAAAGLSGDLRKLFYGGIVVQLYGAFEQFAESLVIDAVGRICEACPTYADIPTIILSHHTTLTLDILQAMAAGRYHGVLQEHELAAGLHHAVSRGSPVKLNTGVFGRHTANFKWEVLVAHYARVGIPINQVGDDPEFIAMSDDRFSGAGNPFEVLNDLAHRRNEISHGWEPDEILSESLVRDYIDFMDVLASAMLRVSIKHVISLVVLHVGDPLGKPDIIYDKTVACYYSLPFSIAVGGLVAISNDIGTEVGTVLSIQKENVDYEQAHTGETVGIRVSKSISAAAHIRILPSECSYLLA
ncbi:hypothetical protein ABID81_002535 [Frigoribacterium sp. PvP054]|uniref:HEPN domain-containing protein n=1 Tax=Frigoribacterium sp. PvP054 TaxID=3156438 RepID=UPI003391A75C